MKGHKYAIIIGLILCNVNVLGQEIARTDITIEQAKVILNESIIDSSVHNLIGQSRILIEKEKVLDFTESVLFGIYGEKNIKKQKPYDVFKINNYWLINGTLPKNQIGGTFLIIIDSRNYQIVRISHGK